MVLQKTRATNKFFNQNTQKHPSEDGCLPQGGLFADLFYTDQVRNNPQFALQHFRFGISHAAALFCPLDHKVDGKSGVFYWLALLMVHRKALPPP